MEKNRLYLGMGLGAAAAATVGMLIKPKKDKKMKKAMKTIGQVVNSVSDVMGW